jgi:NADH-quinone oxidoreductase subunit J
LRCARGHLLLNVFAQGSVLELPAMILSTVSYTNVLPPLLILLICILAGIGTFLVLPSRREATVRGIGMAIAVVAAILLLALLVRTAAGQDDPMGIYFWIFGGVSLASSFRLVTHNRPVYSALYFVLTVFSTAGLFVLMWAEFMAAALVLIYAGAIMVTYVFVIMLAARAGGDGQSSDIDLHSREPLAASALGFGLMALLLFVIFDRAPLAAAPETVPGEDITVAGFAAHLFARHAVNVVFAAVMLGMSMVGAILIARRRIWSPDGEQVMMDTDYEKGDDDPHAVPVTGTRNPRKKAYPEA